MKRQIVKLQGYEVVVSEPAMKLLQAYLGKLQRETVIRRSLYRTNVGALRDICLEYLEHKQVVTAKDMERAINLVGLPEGRFVGVVPDDFKPVVRFVNQARVGTRQMLLVVWLHRQSVTRVLYALCALIALLACISHLHYLYAVTSPERLLGNTAENTSIGPVITLSTTDTTSQQFTYALGEVILLGLSLAITATALWSVITTRYRALRLGLILLCLLGTLIAPQIIQAHAIKAVDQHSSIIRQQQEAAKFPADRLQLCGDEIPLNTDESMFRKLRDGGFMLVATVPTRMSDGTINQQILCDKYDALRKTYSHNKLVLELYTILGDGQVRAYDFQDIGLLDSSYGFFGKQ